MDKWLKNCRKAFNENDDRLPTYLVGVGVGVEGDGDGDDGGVGARTGGKRAAGKAATVGSLDDGGDGSVAGGQPAKKKRRKSRKGNDGD